MAKTGDFSFEFNRAGKARADDTDQPAERAAADGQFRILIAGDFSGRTNRGIKEPSAAIARRKPLPIDVDTFSQIMARLQPEIRLPVGNGVLSLSFTQLEDFRPEALLAKIPAFQGLLNLRAELQDPSTFSHATEKVRLLIGQPSAAAKAAKPPEAPSPAGVVSDFERMLEQDVKPKPAGPVDIDALIANFVAGYSVPEADPEQALMVQLVEDALSAGLRAVLRHPAFQAIESLWRCIEFLTSRLTTDEALKLSLLDLSKEELAGDLAPPDLAQSALHQILIEQMKIPGTVPYALVIGDFEFTASPDDMMLIAKLATLLQEAGIPLLAGAAPSLAGLPSFAAFPDAGKWQPPSHLEMWEKVCALPQATHVGLAAPRFLLRLPYGTETDAVETYAFEEMPQQDGPVMDGYLWGNGAFAVAAILGAAFLENGWQLDAESGADLGDMPLHLTMVAGDKEMTPCAQAWLSDRAGDILRQIGVMPVLSVRNAAAIRVAGIHSIAKPSALLAGAWSNT